MLHFASEARSSAYSAHRKTRRSAALRLIAVEPFSADKSLFLRRRFRVKSIYSPKDAKDRRRDWQSCKHTATRHAASDRYALYCRHLAPIASD